MFSWFVGTPSKTILILQFYGRHVSNAIDINSVFEDCSWQLWRRLFRDLLVYVLHFVL